MFEWYKVQANLYVDYKIDIFLESLKNQYHRRFNDSGLFWLEIMVSDYINSVEKLWRNLRMWIYDFLWTWALGRLILSKTDDFEEFKYTFFLNSYSVTLFCKVWHKEKVMAVEDIYITN
ncbi:MAG: hypothetical protein LBC44_04655 [Mycoplasmataceae bacterium]|jgi:hypothetical protein|nr:hypothetical protein [Mycoplasmataceae bacterium]